ncbi:MAG: hypothetical protein LM590_15925 [Thermofilum sp.]|nr:hypothetical protein [Thermofilum sp.]
MTEEERKAVPKAAWEIVTRTPHVSIPDVSKMPLPAQIIFRAVQHFASKAADGADVLLRYNYHSDTPYLDCMTKHSHFLVEYTLDGLVIKFVKEKEKGGGAKEVRVKQCIIRTDLDVARNIIRSLSIIFEDAICDLYVHSSPEIDEIFNIQSSQ